MPFLEHSMYVRFFHLNGLHANEGRSFMCDSQKHLTCKGSASKYNLEINLGVLL